MTSLIRQRVLQIACGYYEDQNDSNSPLREDPLLKRVWGSLAESGVDLASQPTISRLENALDSRSCQQIAEALFELYLQQRQAHGTPQRVLLDLDATDDTLPTQSRKAATTTAITAGTSTIRFWSSTGRAGI